MKLPRPPALFVLSAVALALLLGHAVGGGPREAQVTQPAPAQAEAPSAARAAGAPGLVLSRRANPEAVTDLFSGHSWTPAPKPQPAAAPAAPPPPPAPVAPPLPFAYVGRVEDPGGKPLVYISRGELLLEVTEGHLIEPDWRVESLDAEEIVFVYLPLAERQRLRTGS